MKQMLFRTFEVMSDKDTTKHINQQLLELQRSQKNKIESTYLSQPYSMESKYYRDLIISYEDPTPTDELLHRADRDRAVSIINSIEREVISALRISVCGQASGKITPLEVALIDDSKNDSIFTDAMNRIYNQIGGDIRLFHDENLCEEVKLINTIQDYVLRIRQMFNTPEGISNPITAHEIKEIYIMMLDFITDENLKKIRPANTIEEQEMKKETEEKDKNVSYDIHLLLRRIKTCLDNYGTGYYEPNTIVEQIKFIVESYGYLINEPNQPTKTVQEMTDDELLYWLRRGIMPNFGISE